MSANDNKKKSKAIKPKSKGSLKNSIIKKNSTKKKVDKISAVVKKQIKKPNLLKLCYVMNKYADDANDKEIIKRFKTTIVSSVNEDISKTNLINILKKPEEVNTSDFSESIQPYIKHYLFMFNRSLHKKDNKK
jgi:hypothetical protein